MIDSEYDYSRDNSTKLETLLIDENTLDNLFTESDEGYVLNQDNFVHIDFSDKMLEFVQAVLDGNEPDAVVIKVRLCNTEKNVVTITDESCRCHV